LPQTLSLFSRAIGLVRSGRAKIVRAQGPYVVDVVHERRELPPFV
jgi:hypothetical protein